MRGAAGAVPARELSVRYTKGRLKLNFRKAAQVTMGILYPRLAFCQRKPPGRQGKIGPTHGNPERSLAEPRPPGGWLGSVSWRVAAG